MSLSLTDHLALIDCLEATAFVVDPATLDVTFPRESSRAVVGVASNVSHRGATFWAALVPPDDLARVMAMLAAVASDGACRTVEHRAVVVDRGEVWLRTSLKRSDAGQSLVGVMQDVSTSRHNERQWREVEQWLVTLGEALPFDFWICDRDGRFVLQNPVSVKRLGHAVGRRVAELDLSAEARFRWQLSFAKALAGELVQEELESTVRGERHCFARVLSPVGEGSEVSAVVGVDIDITQLKHSEEQLRQSVVDLGRAQEVLVRREQLAALGEMAALIAHEVRNPLGAIANAVALLHKGRLTADAGASLQIIDDEVGRLDLLVANLLDFVRPSTATFSPKSLEAVVDSALALTLRTEGAAQRIRVVRTAGNELPLVPMDGQLLEVAFTNVFRNAVQAIVGNGELHVTIDHEARGDRQWARVSIRDNGRGMGHETKSRMFEPFVTTRARGHGLGLTIVKKVIDQHRGEIDFLSEPGQGTTCVLCLPINERVG